MPESLPNTPRDALAAYLLELETVYYPWYEQRVKGGGKWAMRLQYAAYVLAVLSGFATSVVAGIWIDPTLPVPRPVQVVLVVLPALGAAVATLISQAKMLERFQLREEGRRSIQYLIDEARHRWACLKTDDEICAYLEELRRKVDEVEAKQGTAFFSLFGGK